MELKYYRMDISQDGNIKYSRKYIPYGKQCQVTGNFFSSLYIPGKTSLKYLAPTEWKEQDSEETTHPSISFLSSGTPAQTETKQLYSNHSATAQIMHHRKSASLKYNIIQDKKSKISSNLALDDCQQLSSQVEQSIVSQVRLHPSMQSQDEQDKTNETRIM